jgi:predicted translin family RNA/ssDNA-binding protein
VLKEKYRQLADILGGCPSLYYRYHGEWRSETQTVVSVLILYALAWNWKTTRTQRSQGKTWVERSRVQSRCWRLPSCCLFYELPRYVVTQVTTGDYDCPRKILKFLTELHVALWTLNLRNDFLRKKFGDLGGKVIYLDKYYSRPHFSKIRKGTSNFQVKFQG